MRRLGPVEDARQAISGTSPSQGLRTAGQCGYLQPEGTLAAELLGSSAPRLHQSSLRPSGPPLHGKVGRRLIRRTAVVRTRMPGGVGGAASREAPYPDGRREHGATLEGGGQSTSRQTLDDG